MHPYIVTLPQSTINETNESFSLMNLMIVPHSLFSCKCTRRSVMRDEYHIPAFLINEKIPVGAVTEYPERRCARQA